jgi:hypothetical protein
MEPRGSLSFAQEPAIPRSCVTFYNKIIFYGKELLAPPQHPNWQTTPCQLSATAYSMYLQLPFMSGDHLLHPHLKDVPCCGDRDLYK